MVCFLYLLKCFPECDCVSLSVSAAINSHHLPGSRLNIIKLILNSRQQHNLESKTGAGWTALMKACFKGYLDIVQMLLARGVDVNAQAENGFTPLLAASQVRRCPFRLF